MTTLLSFDEFRKAYRSTAGQDLNEEQWAAVRAPPGPVWIIAGPGSGKTETLVARCIRFLMVDGYAPSEVFITTFTEKAAENLRNRVATQLASMKTTTDFDVTDLRLGTLHSLCDQVMRDYKFGNFQDSRLMDEFEQVFFVRGNCDTVQRETAWWENFEPLFGRPPGQYGYNLFEKTKATIALFARISDDLVDVESMAKSRNKPLAELAMDYVAYRETLASKSMADFSTLMDHFLEFLSSPQGDLFMKGSAERERAPLKAILVDEYQDTNPIQERIYFQMAQGASGNLTVVGDDDQALYRFRGGTVDCMVHFPRLCEKNLGRKPARVQLYRNYRSHEAIVKWCNEYISSFKAMEKPNARAQGKRPVKAERDIPRNYRAVAGIAGSTGVDTAELVADTIENLQRAGKIKEMHQVAILFHSTREGPRTAGPYVEALRARGFQVYNPRSKSFVEHDDVAALLGALVEFVDPGASHMNRVPSEVARLVLAWLAAFDRHRATNAALKSYYQKLEQDKKMRTPGKPVKTTLRNAFYHILALDPFRTWMDDPSRTYRIGRLTQLVDSFGSIDADYLGMSSRPENLGEFSVLWLEKTFYQRFATVVALSRLDDVEDPDYAIVPGMIQVMTVHQAKGLEFPFVFVDSVGYSYKVDDSSYFLEDLFKEYSSFERLGFSKQDRATQDSVRFFYVAHSRAEYALFLFGAKSAFQNVPFALGGNV